MTIRKKLSEIVARANDVFDSKFDNIDTLMDIMDKTLGNQVIKADAITIDYIALDKKLVILIYDNKPDVINKALGNKEGDIYSSSEYELVKISEAVIVGLMEVNFIS